MKLRQARKILKRQYRVCYIGNYSWHYKIGSYRKSTLWRVERRLTGFKTISLQTLKGPKP